MTQELIDRIAEQAPAALMFRSLFSRQFSDEKLNEIFAEHRRRQVESKLLFSSLVHLLAPVVSGSRPSVNSSYQMSDLDVSSQAVYDKLQGVEPEVSDALVRSPVKELRRLQDKAKTRRDDIIAGYHTFVIDGKTYNATQHRLKESRKDARAPLPGRAIAMLDTRYELFVDVECEASALRCERKILVPMTDRLEERRTVLSRSQF